MALLGAATRHRSLFTTIFPEALSIASSERSLPSSVELVSQIRPSSITGEDHAFPGMAVFQATLVVSLQCKGKPVALLCP